VSDAQFNLDEMYKTAIHLDNPLQAKQRVNYIEKHDVCLAVQRRESEKFEAAVKYYEYLCRKLVEREKIIGLTAKAST